MLVYRLIAAAATAVFILASCGKDEAEVAKRIDNALLQHVPNGTPYLSANLEPVPNEVVDRFLQRAEPLLQALQGELAAARARIQSDPTASGPMLQVTLAMMEELDGKLNRSGLESLGLDLQAPRAFYGLGAFPIFRMGLSDAESLRAAMQRILDSGGITLPQSERQAQSYWRVPLGDQSAGGPVRGAVYVAILDDQLAVGLFPTHGEDEMLAHLLGQTLPQSSDGADRLLTINQRFGYTPYGTGTVDLIRLADEVFNTESRAGRALLAAGIDLSAQLGATCESEIRQLFANAPRAHSGLTELTPDLVGYKMVLETDPALAGELAGLVAPVPAADTLSTRALEFALGLKVGAVRDFLRAKAAAIAETPYQCGQLVGLNEGARKAYAQLNQPIPPLINNFQGMRISLSEAGTSPANPEEVEGLIAVHVEQPQMFVGMAQMFLPDLAGLQLVPGEPPVQLPASLIPMSGVVAHAALADDAIGLSVGPGEQDRLQQFLTEGVAAPGTFMSVNYDTALYLEYSNTISESMSQRGDDAAPADSPVHDIAQAAREVYKAMAGRTDTRMGFTADGIVIESRMTFTQ